MKYYFLKIATKSLYLCIILKFIKYIISKSKETYLILSSLHLTQLLVLDFKCLLLVHTYSSFNLVLLIIFNAYTGFMVLLLLIMYRSFFNRLENSFKYSLSKLSIVLVA